jgi:glucose dehydrogenase
MDLLYADSIVALDVNTGLYKWHFQTVPGDEWDFDTVQQLLLTDLTIRGQKRKVILQANKNGFLYAIDRTNGKFISATPFAKINWALGVDEGTGRPIINPEAKYSATESVNITPGPGGAHNWSSMSFNPTLGLLYFSGQSGGGFNYAVDPNFKYQPNGLNMGIVFGPPPAAARSTKEKENVGGEVNTARAAAPEPAPAKATQRPALKTIGPDFDGGFLVAIDPATKTEHWRVPGGQPYGGGTVATAGGLVLQTANGTLYAYSADKGEKLLELKIGIPGGMGPPITFMVDGKQYVALQIGQGNVPPPPGAPARAANPNSPPPARPRLLVYALDGAAKLP